MTEQPTRAYRADIDGLRAIAILAVVLFHINRTWVPGGFAGVDIFFVISGYLITAHILKDASLGLFSFSDFYRRRIKRIIPVLLFVVFVTYSVGHFILLPNDFRSLFYSSISSILFVANIYFTYGLDFSYFSTASETEPLLHVWSLGVEEQFYMLWPALMLLLIRLPRRGQILAVAAASTLALLALSELLVRTAPVFAYYMLPARIPELATGALLALLPVRRPGAAASFTAGLSGLALVAFSLALINEGKSFPGLNAVPATLGSALVIFAGAWPRNPVSRILSLRPLVWLGLISYSLYLWHWPVVAYLRYTTGGLSTSLGLAALALILGLAVFSYHVIEKPCRSSQWSLSGVFALQFALPATLLGALCLAVIARDGTIVSTASSETLTQVAKTRKPPQPAYMYDYVCQRNVVLPADLENPKCIINGRKEPRVLLWGDSNAAHYVGVIGAIAKAAHFSFRNIAHSACPPMLERGPDFANPAYREVCAESLQVVIPALARYDTLLVAADWTTDVLVFPGFMEAQLSNLEKLHAEGKTIVLLGRAPLMQTVDRECEAKAQALTWIECEKRSIFARPDTYEVNKTLQAFAASHENVFYFNVDDIICPHKLCSAYLDHEPVYFDNGHFSMDGSWLVGRKVVESGHVPDFFLRLGTPTNNQQN